MPIREGDDDARSVNEFFLRYEKLNSSADAASVCDSYADPFLFGGPHGVQEVRREDFRKAIPKLKAHISSMGLFETKLYTAESSPISSDYLLAKVEWKMGVRTSIGSQIFSAYATYVLLQKREGDFSIVLQIDHQDLAAAIRDLHTLDPDPSGHG
jgi:ketosteroid isomerase-like protein